MNTSNVVSIFDRTSFEQFAETVSELDIASPLQPTWMVTDDLIASWVAQVLDIIELDYYGPELKGPNIDAFEKELTELISKHFKK